VVWRIEFHEEFEAEYDELGEEVQDELLAHLKLLEKFGPGQTTRRHTQRLNIYQHEGIEV
jgi:mRNA-degrading endonuclease RelE of RelBE toxin-antitoxin system